MEEDEVNNSVEPGKLYSGKESVRAKVLGQEMAYCFQVIRRNYCNCNRVSKTEQRCTMGLERGAGSHS